VVVRHIGCDTCNDELSSSKQCLATPHGFCFSYLQTFMPCFALLCHAVLCCAMLQVLSDVRGLTSALADDSAIELWGKVGTAHLASLLTAAAHK
jgi:hypothetical protein